MRRIITIILTASMLFAICSVSMVHANEITSEDDALTEVITTTVTEKENVGNEQVNTDELFVDGDANEVTDGTYKGVVNTDGTVTITGLVNPRIKVVDPVIPGEIEGKTVTAIGDEALSYWIKEGEFVTYWGNSLAGTLMIPDSIKYIGKGAFEGQTELTGDLIIPDSVETIDEDAFSDCCGFDGVLKIGNGVKTIGKYAFWCRGSNDSIFKSSQFKRLILGNNIEAICEGAFGGCGSFTGELKLPGKLKRIGETAFSNCSGFTGNLTIPNSVETIEAGAFIDCTGFNGHLTIGDNVRTIEGAVLYGAFQGCSGLTGNLIIPVNVKKIDKWTFYDCGGFSGNLVIPNGVETIEEYAFTNCAGFDGTLVLPETVKTIGECAFSACNFIGDLKLPDSLKTIGPGAFGGCSFTETLTIPKNTASIGNNAFAGSCYIKRINNESAVELPASSFILYGSDDYFVNEKYGVIKYEGTIGKGTYTRRGEFVKVESLKLNKTNASVGIGSTITLQATVFPGNALIKSVMWSTSDPSVATVSETGAVKGIKKGNVTITASAIDGSDIKATCKVTVSPVLASKISLNKKDVTIYKGKTVTLKAKVLPQKTSNKKVKWKSSNTKIATVSSEGVVKGIKVGKAVITCTTTDGSKKTARCNITVKKPVKVTDVKLNKKTASIKKGKTLKLKVTILPENATNKEVTWKSSKPQIAKVDKNGKVTGIKKGTTKITVTTKDGKKTAICRITVKNK